MKGFNSNNKKVYENKKGINNTFGKNKFNDDKISKGESEYESDNNQIKENIEAIYEPLLGKLNKVVNKIIIRKKKEYLKIIKKNIKIIGIRLCIMLIVPKCLDILLQKEYSKQMMI